jgi:hypothetical protein
MVVVGIATAKVMGLELHLQPTQVFAHKSSEEDPKFASNIASVIPPSRKIPAQSKPNMDVNVTSVPHTDSPPRDIPATYVEGVVVGGKEGLLQLRKQTIENVA